MDISPHDLQPMVKGLNMVNCIIEVMKVIKVLKKEVGLLIDDMQDVQQDIQSHYHISPFFGAPTGTSPTLVAKSAVWGIKMEKRHLKLNAVDMAISTTKLEFLNASSKNLL